MTKEQSQERVTEIQARIAELQPHAVSEIVQRNIDAVSEGAVVYDPVDHIMQVYYATLASVARGMGAQLQTPMSSDPKDDIHLNHKGFNALLKKFKSGYKLLEGHPLTDKYNENEWRRKWGGKNISLMEQNYFAGVKEAIQNAKQEGQDETRIQALQDYYKQN